MSDVLGDLLRIIIPFIVIVGLPAVFLFGHSTIKRILDHREKRMEIEGRLTAEKAAQYAAHNERLEQRVRVLERIVTDKGIDVSDQIENLRGRPVN
jgi:hypothetical protein